MATITERYNQAREDYEFLVSHHAAEVNDITGRFGEGEEFKNFLRLPTKKKAAELYEALIAHSAISGFESKSGNNRGAVPDVYNDRVQEIYVRHCLEDEILVSYGICL